LAGVVQIVTKDPTENSTSDARAGFANYNTASGGFYASAGINDELAVNIAADFSNQGSGWGKNLYNGRDVYRSREAAERAKVLWTPSDTLKVTGSLFYDHLSSDLGPAQSFFPGSYGTDRVTTANPNFFDVDEDLQSGYDTDEYVAGLTVQKDVGWARLVSISGYSHVLTRLYIDLDATPSVISEQNPSDTYSKAYTQELQIASPSDEAKVTWVAGAFYYNNDAGYSDVRVFGTNVRAACGATCNFYDIGSNMHTWSLAGYGQTTYDVTPDLELTAGLRYTHDLRHIIGKYTADTGQVFGAGNQQATFDKLTYKGSLAYHFTDRVLGYVSYSTGFDSGFFATGTPAARAVKPATIASVEAGLKNELFNRRVRLNLTGFHYNYDNLVLRQFQPTGSTILINAANSEIYGADLDLEFAATDRLSFQAAAEWLHAEFVSFPGAPLAVRQPNGTNTTIIGNLAGQPLFLAPDFTANLGMQYRIPSAIGEFLFAANYQFNNGYNWAATANAAGTLNDRVTQGAYSLVNLSLKWASWNGKCDLTLWGKNVTDTRYRNNVQANSVGDTYTPAAPATYGFDVGIHF
jgi:iron complex outermembrane receptor protein